MTNRNGIERIVSARDDEASLALEAVETVLYAVLTDLQGLERQTFEGDKQHTPLNWPEIDEETADKMTNKVLELLQTHDGFARLSIEGQLVAWWKPVDREELEAWKASRVRPQRSEHEERKGMD